MNGRTIAEQLTLERSETLAGLFGTDRLTVDGQIETLYLAALSRKPTAAELKKGKALVLAEGSASTEQNRKSALVDILWMLLNSGEFMFNH